MAQFTFKQPLIAIHDIVAETEEQAREILETNAWQDPDDPDSPIATKVELLNTTPPRSHGSGEVTLFQFVPLSVDLKMFPLSPTPTKVLFPKVTPSRRSVIPEVALSQDEPLSVDLTIFPESPTPTKVLFPKVIP